jgi:hypothetical protein
MKIIFLDIDGVMNSELLYRARHKKRWFTLNHYTWRIRKWFKYIINGFEHKGVSLVNYKTPKRRTTYKYLFNRIKDSSCPLKWKWLSDLCNEHDIKICISSVWKNHFKNPMLWKTALIDLGFNPNVFVGITGERRSCRGEEIQDWLNQRKGEIEYVIIDDDSDMLDEQKPNFFQTDPYVGLTPTTLYKIRRHFKITG